MEFMDAYIKKASNVPATKLKLFFSWITVLFDHFREQRTEVMHCY